MERGAAQSPAIQVGVDLVGMDGGWPVLQRLLHLGLFHGTVLSQDSDKDIGKMFYLTKVFK